MAMTEGSMVIGAFTAPAQLDHAVEQLQLAGFHNIRFVKPGTGEGDLGTHGGLASAIKRVFSGQGPAGGSIIDDLVSMGVPQETARYYQHEFELGRSIMAVEVPDRREEALLIIRQNGGYDATTRSATNDSMAPPQNG